MAQPIAYEAFLKLDTGTHTGSIVQIAVTPDGQTLVSAGECTIRVWDIGSGKLVRMLLGQVADRSEEIHGNGNVVRFALSPDGRWLVALKQWRHQQPRRRVADETTEVQVFELATGNLQAAYRHPGVLLDLDFSPDGSHLAMVGHTRGRNSRRGVVGVYAWRRILRAGFGRVALPLAEHVFARCARDAELAAAVRFIPVLHHRRGGHRLVVAAGHPDAAGRAAGTMSWYRFAPRRGLSPDHVIQPAVAINPATLAVSHEFVAIADAPERGPHKPVEQFRVYDHAAAPITRVVTPGHAQTMAFSGAGCHLLVGLATDSAPGDETVQVDAYEVVCWDFLLRSTYYGHDATITALALLADGTAVSTGGDNQAIHFWATRHRVGEPVAAIRGVGRCLHNPGINAAEQVSFGTVPPRLLPARHGVRLQRFCLRSMTLTTTGPDEVDGYDFETDKWVILSLNAQVIALRYNPTSTQLDRPPDLTLFVGADDEWVIWSRSGYYNASPGGDRHFGYHVNRGAAKEALYFPGDRFKVFYRPDLIAAIVEHGTEDHARAHGIDIPVIDVAAFLPPVVELLGDGVEVGPDTVTFTFTAAGLRADNPVTRAWILRNDRFVWSEAGAQPSYRVVLPLKPGPNVFSIRAETRDAKSMPVVQVLEGPEVSEALRQQEAASGNLYLLSVGVSDFAVAGTEEANGFKPLLFAHQDAIAVYNAFARSILSGRLEPQAPLRNLAFDDVEATLLLNVEASKAAILHELKRLCSLIKDRSQAAGAERDVLFVFLSGHGTRFAGEPELYFWNHDLRPRQLEETGLSMVDLGEIITSVPAEVVLVIDACHAGMAGGNVMRGLDAEELAKRIQGLNERGMYVLNASRSEEKARENKVLGQGVFTRALLGALESERFMVPELPGSSVRAIGMLGLIAAVQELVPFFTAQAQTKTQTPVCRMYGDLLPLTIYKK